jgi:hypothetical protein
LNVLTPLQQYTTIVTGGAPTAFNFAGASCSTSDTSSTTYGSANIAWNVDAIALIVYYTGTPVPLSNALKIDPCLSLNTAVNELGIDATCLPSSGTLSGQTAGYAVEAASATSATGPFPMDDAITTAATVTVHKSLAIADPTHPSQMTMTYSAGHPLVPGSATSAVYGVDASGFAVGSEAGAAASRFCTAANGVCSTGGSVPPPPGFPQQLLGMSGTQTSNTVLQTPTIVPDGLECGL